MAVATLSIDSDGDGTADRTADFDVCTFAGTADGSTCVGQLQVPHGIVVPGNTIQIEQMPSAGPRTTIATGTFLPTHL